MSNELTIERRVAVPTYALSLVAGKASVAGAASGMPRGKACPIAPNGVWEKSALVQVTNPVDPTNHTGNFRTTTVGIHAWSPPDR
mgnify:CR=1 FL=1